MGIKKEFRFQISDFRLHEFRVLDLKANFLN